MRFPCLIRSDLVSLFKPRAKHHTIYRCAVSYYRLAACPCKFCKDVSLPNVLKYNFKKRSVSDLSVKVPFLVVHIPTTLLTPAKCPIYTSVYINYTFLSVFLALRQNGWWWWGAVKM